MLILLALIQKTFNFNFLHSANNSEQPIESINITTFGFSSAKNRTICGYDPFSNFLTEVDAGRVVEVTIQGNNISGILADGKTFSTY